MHMRGTRTEKEVDICATNLTNKIKCITTNARKRGKELWRHIVCTTSSICGIILHAQQKVCGVMKGILRSWRPLPILE
jgi:hypothetical protein